jgi:hypothetical protein
MIAEPPLDGGHVTELTEVVFAARVKAGKGSPEASA